MIKPNCVCCGDPATGSKETDEDRYHDRGNWCQRCNQKVDIAARQRRTGEDVNNLLFVKNQEAIMKQD